MTKIWVRGAFASLALFMLAQTPRASAEKAHAMPQMQWSDLLARPRPKAGLRMAYGSDPNQMGDLWRPDGKGPHPLVIMIHGGCWEAATAGLDIMDWAAEDLRQHGFLVWNVEYRRIDQAGGGWPGTYDDIRSAISAAYTQGSAWGADLHRIVLLGHSAGGHLALWAAKAAGARGLKGVVGLGAITDLVADTQTGCGDDGLPKMRGPDPKRSSPYQMAPLSVPAVLITGLNDTTVPLTIAKRYKDHAQALGGQVELQTPPGGHVEEIAPGSEGWSAARLAVQRLVGP
jgi:acetyl esterase/lipase